MVDDDALVRILTHLLSQQKALYQLVTMTMAETASLRETVRGLDPTFSDVLTQKREEYRDKLIEQYRATLKEYDDLIKALNS
jgi:hypothetical protein